jgi:hypothetical protein
MRDVQITRKAVAVVLCVTVWNLCAVAGFAREIGTAPGDPQVYSSPIAGLLSAAQSRHGGATLSPAPAAVSGTMGHVTWKRLPAAEGAWACRTGSGSVTLDLKQAGKIAVLENSNVDVRADGEQAIVTLLRGSVRVSGPAGTAVRIQTLDGTYTLGGPAAYEARFTWRGGALAIVGDAGQRTDTAMKSASLVLSTPERVTLVNGRPGAVSARVVDALGEPLAGVPVVFTAKAAGGKVSFGGAPNAVVFTDDNGVAGTMATVLGAANVEIDAAVAGTEAAAAAQAGVQRTTGRQKWVALAVLGAVAAATVALVIVTRDEDNPKLEPGTPTRVTP